MYGATPLVTIVLIEPFALLHTDCCGVNATNGLVEGLTEVVDVAEQPIASVTVTV